MLGDKEPIFLISKNCHPQNIAVVQQRAEPVGIIVDVVDDQDIKEALTNPGICDCCCILYVFYIRKQ